MSEERDCRGTTYRLQLAGVLIGAAGLFVAVCRAVIDLWIIFGR